VAVLPDLPLPPNQDLWDSCVVRVTAIDPTTGDLMPGVTVGEVTLGVEQLSGPPVKADNPLLIGVSV
jgi:hypothetical protein